VGRGEIQGVASRRDTQNPGQNLYSGRPWPAARATLTSVMS
jgi:hypothetical protein